MAGADEDDGVGFEVGELAGPHAGSGEQFDDQAVAGIGAGPGRCHEPGGIAVVEEPGPVSYTHLTLPTTERV